MGRVMKKEPRVGWGRVSPSPSRRRGAAAIVDLSGSVSASQCGIAVAPMLADAATGAGYRVWGERGVGADGWMPLWSGPGDLHWQNAGGVETAQEV